MPNFIIFPILPEIANLKKRAMKKLIVLLILLFPVNALAHYKIATFNTEFLTKPKVHMKYGFGFDMQEKFKRHWSKPGFRNEMMKRAVNAVADHIASIDADIIGLTEIGKLEDVNQLIEAIKERGVSYDHVSFCRCTSGSTSQYVALLSKFPLTTVKTKFQRKVDGFRVTKGLKASVDLGGEEVIIYLTHLKSKRGGAAATSPQRVAQATVIRDDYRDDINAGKHVIVMGDLNASRGEPALKRIRGLHDDSSSNVDLDQPGKDGIFTYRYRGQRNQIDHILTSPSIGKKWNVSIEAIETPNEFISDHRALAITLN